MELAAPGVLAEEQEGDGDGSGDGGGGGRGGGHRKKLSKEERRKKLECVIEEDDDGYQEKSCFCLQKENRFRKVCTCMLKSPWFDRASMFVICLNCIVMAMYDTADSECATQKCKVQEGISMGFSVFFIIEMFIKIFAMGFYGQGSYLADNWNRLDFIIVVFSIVDFLPIEGGPLKLLRIMRVLRPLRAINKLPSLRVLIQLIMKTLPQLGDVLLLLGFIFFVFSILGVQLFQGLMRNRCQDPRTGELWTADLNGGDPYICTIAPDNGMNTCLPGDIGDGAANYTTCVAEGENPNNGVLSFDDIFHAFTVIFLVISMEGWVEVMYAVQDAFSFYVFVYFIFLVFLGGLLAMNLFLVVIATQFGACKEEERQKMREEEEFQGEQPLQPNCFNKFTWCFLSVFFGRHFNPEEEMRVKKEKVEAAIRKKEDEEEADRLQQEKDDEEADEEFPTDMDAAMKKRQEMKEFTLTLVLTLDLTLIG